jgi:hypothetical protein
MPSKDIAIDAVLPANSGWSSLAFAMRASRSPTSSSAASGSPTILPTVRVVSCQGMPKSA